MPQIVDIDRYLCTGALIYMREGPFPKSCQEVRNSKQTLIQYE